MRASTAAVLDHVDNKENNNVQTRTTADTARARPRSRVRRALDPRPRPLHRLLRAPRRKPAAADAEFDRQLDRREILADIILKQVDVLQTALRRYRDIAVGTDRYVVRDPF